MSNPSREGQYAVIFPNQFSGEDAEGYRAMAERMVALAAEQPGCCGMDSARGPDGFGITVSYWDSLDAIKIWRDVAEHQEAQRLGREKWYDTFDLHVAKIEKSYSFTK